MYTDESILPFGKYKFTKMCRIPADYLLKFLVDKSHPELHEYVVNNVDKIKLRKDGLMESPSLKFPCDKLVYITEKDAKEALKKIINTQQSHKKPIRTYECEKCGGWHLTSVSLNNWQNKKIYNKK